MKTKTQILKMSKQELEQYKWSKYLDEKSSDCSNCFTCFNCTDCTDCYMCRNAKRLKYAICNVEMSKEDYEKKMAELKAEV